MRQKPGTKRTHGEKAVKDIRGKTRRLHSAEEKIRIVFDSVRYYGSAAAPAELIG